MADIEQRRWRAFIAARVGAPAEIRRPGEPMRVGLLRTAPSAVVRYDVNPDAEPDQPLGFRILSSASPVAVEGVRDDAANWNVMARLQLWRLCALFALEWGAAWWPLCAPEEAGGDDLEVWARERAGVGSERVAAMSDVLARSTMADPGDWLYEAWGRLEKDPDLEQIARTHLNAQRALSQGHREAEIAMMQFVAVFDSLGRRLGALGSSQRVLVAMQESYRRHYCPELRRDADEAGFQLHEFGYEARCQVAHEAVLKSLAGHNAGPLGDKPSDVEQALQPLDTTILRALGTQARFLLRGQLGGPNPEVGRCVHSP
ncbi:MAG: hypothetical protein WD646_00290 [Actinomycetota bacterium]